MTTAGEAADLFGAPDTSHDPFAGALGRENPRDEHGTTQAADTLSDLFGSATEEFPLDGAGSSSVPRADAHKTWCDPAGPQSYSYDSTASTGYSQAHQTQSPHAPPNGNYSQYGHYGQSSQPAALIASAYEPSYAQQSTYAPQQSYAPYTQGSSVYNTSSAYSTSAVTPAYARSVTNTNGAYSSPAYDPYKPTQTQSIHDVSSKSPNTAASLTYDPYQPSYSSAVPGPTLKPTHSYGNSPHTSAYAPSAVPMPLASVSSTPPAPPPTVTVAQYRPKTANAFDPPVPPPKTRHVSTPRQTKFSSPPVTPPPRTTLTPQTMPPAPRRTPHPHPHAVPPRQDSQPLPLAPPRQATLSPIVNGSAPMNYQPSHGLTNNQYGSGSPFVGKAQAGDELHEHGSSSSYTGGVYAGGSHAQEGLPQVNSTYAPPVYSGVSQETISPVVPSSPIPSVSAAASPVFKGVNGTTERVASPDTDAVPEADEEGVQDENCLPILESAVPIPITPSPPFYAGMQPNAEVSWQPTLNSSPERTKSPPQALPSRQAQPAAYGPYVPPPRSNASDRAKSPGASSVHSIQKVYEPPRRDSVTKASPISRPLSSQSRKSTLSNGYEPQTIHDRKRAASPAGSVRSVTAQKQGVYDPYAPVEKAAAPIHGRQTSDGSIYTTASTTDPYIPARYPARQSSEHTYGSFALPSHISSLSNGIPATTTYDRTGGQVVTLVPQTHSTYAPSPSLLGTNDPLGRTSARIPVISFGFGGKLVTCFHGANMNTGFDVALSSRQSTDVKIQLIHKVIPETVLDTSAGTFPGPLYSDPGSPTASLVRTTAQALKGKKARVIKYLEDRAADISGGLGYHKPGSVDRSRAEAKRTLVLLLKAMVENDGRLSGSVQVDAVVRAALVSQEGMPAANEVLLNSGLLPATSTEHLSGYSTLASALPNSSDSIVSQSSVRASQLDKISDLLARGDRRGACHYAADEKLWSHALLIASSVDKECWKEVVTEWIRDELVADPAQPQDGKHGREPLRVAYSLFSGSGAAAVQELVHPSSLLQYAQTNTLQIPQPQLNITPMTPNFPTATPLNISQEVLASWAKTAAMILLNPLTPDSSQALTALGDQLAIHQCVEAAHVCYLLSPQTSPVGGSSRLTLLGSLPPAFSPTFYKDPDPVIFSEILEFATSLATPAKGQEPFNGLPHLQPYRLIRAVCLAEMGYVQLANRYCEAITACINRGSPVLNITFVEQLKNLSDRLIAAPQLDKSGSWIGGKMTKPSLDSIGNWLEGRFTKFIAGETDSPRPEETKSLEQQQKSSYSGPFANYSSISSATTSAYPSPHQSVTDLSDVPPVPAPPFRTGSAMGLNRPPSRSTHALNRSSSAMDYVRPLQQQRVGSPIARVASANAATFADTAFNGQARGPYGYGAGYTPAATGSGQLNDSNFHDVSSANHSKPSANSWWAPPEQDVTTPTASSFGPATSNSDFISLMDDPMLSMTPTATKMTSHPSQDVCEDDDDDLGLGNSSSKQKANLPENGDASHGAAPSQQEVKPTAVDSGKPAEAKPAASSGWLSRLWKRDNSSPAPVKANLGEQSAFYFDKELGKWVNKNATTTDAKPAPPPPPPRAQTASPGRSFGAGPPPPSPLAAGPPLARPATTGPIDLSSEPPRRPPTRVRSNLVPNDAADQPSTPPSPMPTLGTPPPSNGPPAGRARGSGPAKRAVRSRYVDVFQQEGAA